MFISTSERLCAICVWLDWIDLWNFILDYGLVHTWFTHITQKSNVQWMPISFVWLYSIVICVCSIALMIKPKNIFGCFMCFWKWFFSLCFLKVFLKCQIFSVEKLFFWPFCECFREWPPVAKFLKNFNFLKISGKEFRESLVSSSRLKHDPWKSALCIYIFRE